ncbi:MAG: MarR family transcriptional regulator [Rhodobacteraceae bacterium]|nr:MAG: MarR family transcriptional regulator [Paracoccaceae bacterium]
MSEVIRHIDDVALPDLLRGRVSYRIRLLQIAAYKSFEKVVTGFGTAPRYFGMLKIIEANPGIPQTRLAEAIYLDRSSLVPILTALTREGWIERRPARGDRRVRRVFLTPQGAERLVQLDAQVAEHEAMMTRGLSEPERETLLGLLDRVNENLRASLAHSKDEEPTP